MGADEPDKEEERVPADPPASGQRADHEVTAPGVELPNAPDTRPADGEEDSSQPAEDVPDDDASRERGDE